MVQLNLYEEEGYMTEWRSGFVVGREANLELACILSAVGVCVSDENIDW